MKGKTEEERGNKDICCDQIRSDQSLSGVQLFATP